MTTVDLSDAEARLGEIISTLNDGEQLVIIQDGKPLATLTRSRQNPWPCSAGSAKNTKHWMAPDFDAPLEDFGEYMV